MSVSICCQSKSSTNMILWDLSIPFAVLTTYKKEPVKDQSHL